MEEVLSSGMDLLPEVTSRRYQLSKKSKPVFRMELLVLYCDTEHRKGACWCLRTIRNNNYLHNGSEMCDTKSRACNTVHVDVPVRRPGSQFACGLPSPCP